jgi:hypothetical protein
MLNLIFLQTLETQNVFLFEVITISKYEAKQNHIFMACDTTQPGWLAQIFKATCCLHLQGRKCKLSRIEIYIIQCGECRDSNLSSTMAAYAVYTEGRGSGFLQKLAQIYHTIQRHIPDEAACSSKYWHPSTTLHRDTFQQTLILMLTATKHQFSHIWLVFTLWFSVRSKPAEHNLMAAAQSSASALVSSNSEKPHNIAELRHTSLRGEPWIYNVWRNKIYVLKTQKELKWNEPFHISLNLLQFSLQHASHISLHMSCDFVKSMLTVSSTW